MPQFATVGLPEGVVKESKDRVKSAIKNSGYEFPARRITINLAPADIRKDGAAFDLPIAIGLLAATGVVNAERLENSSSWVNCPSTDRSSRCAGFFRLPLSHVTGESWR